MFGLTVFAQAPFNAFNSNIYGGLVSEGISSESDIDAVIATFNSVITEPISSFVDSQTVQQIYGVQITEPISNFADSMPQPAQTYAVIVSEQIVTETDSEISIFVFTATINENISADSDIDSVIANFSSVIKEGINVADSPFGQKIFNTVITENLTAADINVVIAAFLGVIT